MNFPAVNTFPFRPSPNLFNAQVGEPRLPVRKLSVFCWIDTQTVGLRRTVSRCSQVRRFRVTSLLPSLPRLARFHLHIYSAIAWTTKAVTDFLWKDGVPALSVIWLGEPDLTEHESAPGAPPALAAIKSSDENLAAVLSALDRQAARETTDLFVVSDHGFSTIKRSIDLRKILRDAGFVAKTEFEDEPKPGDIMLVGNGGSVLFYVVGHDATVTRRLVEFLQQSDFAGVIFTKQGLPGTFHLDDAKIDNPHAPDVVMAFRWNDSKNQFGTPGMIDADWQRKAGEGTHATLSRFDMHNTLIAAGPDFRRGQTDDLPTGNVDVAPTILHILGIKAPQEMDGRVLSEAMVSVDPVSTGRKTETKTIEAKKDFAAGTWRQSLNFSVWVRPFILMKATALLLQTPERKSN